MENTKENNITSFQTEKERRQESQESREGQKTSFEYCMEWGDVWNLQKTEQFQEASSVVQYDMMGKALDKRIELNDKTFLGILNVDREKAGLFFYNAIVPLKNLRNALAEATADEQIKQSPFAKNSFDEEESEAA